MKHINNINIDLYQDNPTIMIMTFGLIYEQDPRDLNQQQLRDLISQHGVILFPRCDLSHQHQLNLMNLFGPVQNWRSQQAPREYLDKTHPHVVLLDNNDWLGRGRMVWHMDLCYQPIQYLPIRSLACISTDPGNSTEFADACELTDQIVGAFDLQPGTQAEFRNGGDNSQSLTRSALNYCAHLNRHVLRYDTRMTLLGTYDNEQFHQLCINKLNTRQVSTFSVTWQPGDFVVFDNNRAIHRRQSMTGICNLSRITSKFWLN